MKIKKTTYNELESHFDEINSWNDPNSKVKDYDTYQFEKNKSEPFDWWIALDDQNNFVGAMGVSKNKNEVYLNEIMAKPKGGFGTKMIKSIINHYEKTIPNLKSIQFDSYSARDKENGTNSLADYYSRNFPEFEQSQNSWGGTHYTKNLQKESINMKNSDKVTLTIGQLKKLINEDQVHDDYIAVGKLSLSRRVFHLIFLKKTLEVLNSREFKNLAFKNYEEALEEVRKEGTYADAQFELSEGELNELFDYFLEGEEKDIKRDIEFETTKPPRRW